MNRSKCKGCGADIIWITTAAGKKMPCDAIPDYFAEAEGGNEVFIDHHGQMRRGVRAGFDELESYHELGYTPHWATCPHAGRFKKGR